MSVKPNLGVLISEEDGGVPCWRSCLVYDCDYDSYDCPRGGGGVIDAWNGEAKGLQ